jgi:hypothetical protein
MQIPLLTLRASLRVLSFTEGVGQYLVRGRDLVVGLLD